MKPWPALNLFFSCDEIDDDAGDQDDDDNANHDNNNNYYYYDDDEAYRYLRRYRVLL